MNVGTLEIQLLANMAKLQQDMDAAKRSVSGAMAGIEAAVNVAKAALASLAAGLSVNAFMGMIRGAIEAKAGLQQLSEQTGSTVESLSALKGVAKLSETPMESVADVINKLSKNMIAARDSASPAAIAFKALGVTSKDISANMDDPAKMLLVLAQRLDKFKDGAGKTAIEMEIMGKSVAGILPFIKDLAEKNELVAKTTTAQAQEADKFEKIMVQMQGKWKGIYSIIADEVLPVLNDFFGAMLKGGGIAKTVTEYVKQLAKEGKIREWAEAAKAGVDTLMTSMKTAASILAAYMALFVGLPAVLSAASAAFVTLYGAIGTTIVGMATGQASTFSFNAALFGTSISAQMAAGSLSALTLASSVLFAAFAGWQLGKWLSDNFVEARMAGLTFVAVMLKGWENLKYGAEMAWQAIQYAWTTTVNTMKGLFADYLSTVATGLNAVGATTVASQVATYADGLRAAAASQKSFSEQTAGLTEAHRKAIAAIDDDVTATMLYEETHRKMQGSLEKTTQDQKISNEELAKAAEAAAAAAAAKTAAESAAAAAAKKEQEAYATLISSIKAKTEENKIELAVGQNATASQRELVKLEQQLASGKLVLTAAHIAATKAAIQEQAETEKLLKTRDAEKATLEWITKSTQARNAAKDSLEAEYKLYGKSNDAKEIARIKLKAESDLELEIASRKSKHIEVSQEMLRQMTAEKDTYVEVMQSISGQLKGIGYAEQLAEENKRFIAESIFDEKQHAAALLEIDAGIWRDRIAQAGEGTEAQKKLQENYVIWYKNQGTKPQLEENRKVWESIDNTAHDTFISIFDSGKSAFDRLRDTLKNGLLDILYQMTIKKWILSIGASVSGGLVSGAANAAGSLTGGGGLGALGGLGSIAQMGSSLVSAFTGGLQVAYQNFALGGTGAMLGLSNMGVGTGTMIGGLPGTGSMILPNVGQTLTPLGSLGSGIASAAPYIAAAALLYQGLQMGEKQMTGQTVTGSIGANTDLARNVSWSQSGGFLRSDRSGTWSYNLANSTAMADGKPYVDTASLTSDKALLKSLMDSYELLKKSSSDYAKALGLDASIIAARSDQISFAVGKTAEETQENVKKMFEGIGNNISSALLGPLADLAKEGESSSDTLARLASDISGVNDAMKVLGQSAYKLDAAGITAAENLVKLYGGLQNLQTISSAYYDKYYTDAEKAKLVTGSLTAEFQKIGTELPNSLAQLRQWIEAAKALGTEAGDKTYVSLMQLSGAFASLQDLNGASKTSPADLQKQKSDIILQIMEAQGLGLQALNLKRQTEIALMDEELQPLARKLDLALQEKDARELANRQASLAVQILELEGKTAEAAALKHKLEMDATEAGLKPQAERIYQLQQEASALEVAKQHRSLDIELMRALGNEEAAVAAERADALVGMDDYSKAIKSQIWAALDAKAKADTALQQAQASAAAEAQRIQQQQQAAEQAAQEAKQAWEQQKNQAISNVQSAFNAASSVIQDMINNAGGYAREARKAIDSMMMGSDSPLTRAQKFLLSQQNMPSVVAAARAGDQSAIGKLTESVQLSKASRSSFEEYVVDFAKAKSILEETASTAETQESIAKNQLAAMKAEVDAVLGVDKSVMSLGDAIRALQDINSSGLADVASAVNGQYVASHPKASAPSTTTGPTPDQIYGGMAGEGVIQARRAQALQEEAANAAKVRAYRDQLVQADLQLAERGGKTNDFYMEMNSKYYSMAGFQEIARQMGIFANPDLPTASQLPSFDIGTNFVPRDMLALIHEGEAVVPKAYNPAANPGSANAGTGREAQLEKLVEKLTEEVQGLRKEAQAIAISNGSMASNMRRVMSPAGNSFQTTEVPA